MCLLYPFRLTQAGVAGLSFLHRLAHWLVPGQPCCATLLMHDFSERPAPVKHLKPIDFKPSIAPQTCARKRLSNMSAHLLAHDSPVFKLLLVQLLDLS